MRRGRTKRLPNRAHWARPFFSPEGFLLMNRVRRMVCAAVAAGAIGAAIIGVGSARVQAQPRGKAIYDARCIECHGESGRGDGPSAGYLSPRPRDFTTGRYKIRSTETGSVPTDEDLIQSVQQGLYGTAMPGWARILSETEIRDVVTYLKA